MRRELAGALAAVWLLAAAPGAGAQETGGVATLPAIGPHWVWVPDWVFAHSLLFDGDSGKVLGMLDSGVSGTPKLPLLARARGEIYSVDIAYARGRRGARSDFVTIYDAESLGVVGEVALEHPTADSVTAIAHAALLDGDRFLLVFSQFPSALVSVVDLEERRVAGEVPIAGCAGVYPAGPQRFATLCGDGRVLVAELGPTGAPAGTTHSEPFFDVIEDPVGMAGARLGAAWVFVSFAGRVHVVDLAGDRPRPEPPWSLLDEEARTAGWLPGGHQPVALHRDSGRLYVVMHQGGAGSHKEPGPEIWGYDLAQRTRIARIEVPNLTAAFLAPLLGIEAGGFTAWLLRQVTPSPGAHSIAVTQDERPLLFARNTGLGVVAVLDAASGEHLRNLEEAGTSGPTLGVP